MKRFMPALLALGLLSGCASGMKYAEFKTKAPALKERQGRIVVYRPSSFGFAVKPDVYLNETETIGNSQSKGFFYVDKPAGQYICSAHTEVKRNASFALEAGETKYVKTSISMGFLVGHPNFELVDAAEAEAELESCAFTGVIPPAEPPKEEPKKDEKAGAPNT